MSTFKNSKKDFLNQRLDMGKQPIILASLTTAERDAINDLAKGMLICNSDTNSIQFYNGTTWVG